jgi:hypothetical protein
MNPNLAKALATIEKSLSNIDWDESFYHKRLPEFETFDEIRIVMEPRWKTSGLSGDEWRFSASIQYYFKGQICMTKGARDIESAHLLIGNYTYGGYEGIPEKVLEMEKEYCDNIGCREKAENWFALRRQTADNGAWLEQETSFVYYRKFCQKHSHRGDCSREDNDKNYVSITKISHD